MRAYDYELAQLTESGLSGVAHLTAARIHFAGASVLRCVNLTIPNDPWPETYALRVSWTCTESAP